MDKAEFINEIENILHENGAIKELQTKIRSELIEILLNKKQLQPCKDVTDVDKSVNLLIIEHLMQNGLWYTASIMASEAEFIEPPPEIETVMTTNSGVVKRHSPAKLRQMSVANVLRALDNPNLSAKLSEIHTDYQACRSKSLLSFCLRKMPVVSEQPEDSIYSKALHSTALHLKVKKSSQRVESPSASSEAANEELAKKDVEISKLSHEIKLLRASSSAASVIEKECQRQRSLIDTQRKEIEDLQTKMARIDVEAKVPPQHLNVKTYLAGVKMNLNTLEKENEQLEEEINDVSSC